MQRKLAFLYGVLCYVAFLATFVYSIGFIGNVLAPTSLDGAPKAPLLRALLIDVGLLGLFAIQHSVMARQWFKRWWTRAIPEPVERSTYVLFSSVALLLLFWLWEPIGGVIWESTLIRLGFFSYTLPGPGGGPAIWLAGIYLHAAPTARCTSGSIPAVAYSSTPTRRPRMSCASAAA